MSLVNGSIPLAPQQALAQRIRVEVALELRDRFVLELEVENGVIRASRLSGSGCPDALALLALWRSKLTGALADVPVPQGEAHAEILLRELLLKAQGRWEFPFTGQEICHCRGVPTEKVDAAVTGGCKTVAAVSRETSACTSCGSCRPDIEDIIAYRLNRKPTRP